MILEGVTADDASWAARALCVRFMDVPLESGEPGLKPGCGGGRDDDIEDAMRKYMRGEEDLDVDMGGA